MFICSFCDSQYSKWTGRCLECGKWGSVSETDLSLEEKKDKKPVASAELTPLSQIDTQNYSRLQTNNSEIDQVFGGGIVPGSLILLGGEPGIGKSTLSLQLCNSIENTLYFSGEESISQVSLRAKRLNIISDKILLSNATNIEKISATIKEKKPPLAIVDSIQTMWSKDTGNDPGSPNSIRACTTKLLEVAKSTNCSIVIIGHVTKDGGVAGPKTLEHLVDTVLYLEGDRYHTNRLLRTVKNRFGSTDEVGIFTMTEKGLEAILNPSAAFLAERSDQISGSVLTCLMEGTRPLLVEIQALVNKTAFGYPQRKASGIDLNRLHVLAAVLEKRSGIPLNQFDIHINVIGGIKVKEPAADLAICAALVSAWKDIPFSANTVFFGEVGLGGEVRKVSQTPKRINESVKQGMEKIYCAKSAAKTAVKKSEVSTAAHIKELVTLL